MSSRITTEYQEQLQERFLRYVKIDTRSDDSSKSKTPEASAARSRQWGRVQVGFRCVVRLARSPGRWVPLDWPCAALATRPSGATMDFARDQAGQLWTSRRHAIA